MRPAGGRRGGRGPVERSQDASQVGRSAQATSPMDGRTSIARPRSPGQSRTAAHLWRGTNAPCSVAAMSPRGLLTAACLALFLLAGGPAPEQAQVLLGSL